MLVVFLGGCVYCLAAGLQAGAQNQAMLYAGRACVGIGMAFGNQAAPVSGRGAGREAQPAGCRARAGHVPRGAAARQEQHSACWETRDPTRDGCAPPPAQVWMSEVALPRIRGALVAFYQLAVVIGILTANLTNYGTGKMATDGWRISLGVFAGATVLVVIWCAPRGRAVSRV